MVLNKRGGKKAKKGKRDKRPQIEIKGRVREVGEDEIYGRVLKRAGERGIIVECSDGVTRNARIPGRFRKRVWINKDDIVICGLGTHGDGENDKKCEIEYKYNPSEISILRAKNAFNFDFDEDDEDEDDFGKPGV